MAHHQRTNLLQKQKQFETLFALANSVGKAGAFRLSSEKFLEAVNAAPSVWTKHRFFAFIAFLDVLVQDDSMTQDYIDLITQDFIDNENEPAHIRAFATIHASNWYTKRGVHMNYNTATELQRQGADIIAASPKEDENRKVLYHPHNSLPTHMNLDRNNDLDLKTVLGLLDETIRGQLAESNVITGPNQPDPMTLPLLQRGQAGGEVCDCCGKTLTELRMTSFMRCSRCEMVFYCSPTCQREHWKHKGHKQACREQGQIVIGDDMQYLDKTKPSLLVFVQVISCVGGDRWQVKCYGSNRLATVDSTDLTRIRPPSTL